MLVQAIPWAFNKYVTEGEWSNISFRTWSDNLKFPWQWDNNKFNNNQFAHPYHGSLYFNAGRANGYNFWESVPWAFGGSLMWELFGEVGRLAQRSGQHHAGGDHPGRDAVSVLLPDPRQPGDRLEPGGAGNRRRTDQSGPGVQPAGPGRDQSISETPPDWRPTRIQASMDVGYRVSPARPRSMIPSALDAAFVQFSVFYGSQLADLGMSRSPPFSCIGTVASRSADTTRFRSSGSGATSPPSRWPGWQ